MYQWLKPNEKNKINNTSVEFETASDILSINIIRQSIAGTTNCISEYFVTTAAGDPHSYRQAH